MTRVSEESGSARTKTRAAPAHDLMADRPMAAVLRLALPTTAVMLIAAASNVVYTYYISRLGAEAIAAVSLVFPLSLIALTSLGGGLATGTASAVARALGSGQAGKAALAALHAAVLAFLAGVLFACAVYGGAEPLFFLLGGRNQVLEQASEFARWLFAGAAIGFTNQVLDGVLRAEANVRTPAVWTTVALFLQILLTPVFLFGLQLGLAGAALGTIAAQGLVLVPRLLYFFRGRSSLPVGATRFRWSAALVREILRVGIPASLSTTIHYTGLMALTGLVARFGNAPLAAYGLGTRLDFLLLSFGFGFGSAVLTLVGYATGAGQFDQAWRYVRSAGACASGGLALAGLLFFCWPEAWVSIFTSEDAILAHGRQYLRIVAPTYPFLGLSMMASFAFQGLGRATLPLFWNILRVGVVVVSAFAGVRYLQWTEAGVFAVIAVANIASAVVLSWLLRAQLRARVHQAPAGKLLTDRSVTDNRG